MSRLLFAIGLLLVVFAFFDAPAPVAGERRWNDAGSLKEIRVVEPAICSRSQIVTSEGSFFVLGLPSGRNGRQVLYSDCGWLQIGAHEYKIIGW